MKCQGCGQEIGDGATCGFCGTVAGESSVREMSRMENLGYRGVTIDEAGVREDGGFFGDGRSAHGPGPSGSRIYVNGIQLGHSGSWVDWLLGGHRLSRLAVGLAVAAITAVLVFVALPVMLMVAAVGIVIWLLLRLFHPRL